MAESNLKLKTRIKLRILKLIEGFINFLFKIKFLKVNEANKKRVLEDARKKEADFVGGKDKFILREIRVELINRCNTQCIMCPRESQKRKSGKMQLDFYKKLIKEAYDLGAKALYPYHMGESLILRNFCEYMRIARDIGYTTIMLTTTGGLIKQYDPEELVSCGLTILNFSVDAISQDSYGKIRTNMKLEDIERSIRKIMDAKKRLNTDLEVSVKYMDLPGINDGEWTVFKKRWENVVDKIYRTIVHDWGGKTELMVDNRLAPEDYCRFLRQKLIFSWDGTAMFCCMDFDNQLPIGKYPEQSLKEIMDSAILKKARKMHYKGNLNKHPMCQQCYMSPEQGVVDSYRKKARNKILSFSNRIRGKSNEAI